MPNMDRTNMVPEDNDGIQTKMLVMVIPDSISYFIFLLNYRKFL